MVSSSGMRFSYPPRIRSAQRNAWEARDAFLLWQGISTTPWTRSHTDPMTFWNTVAAASQACRAVPPAASVTAAAAMAPAAPISTWHPATSAAKVLLRS